MPIYDDDAPAAACALSRDRRVDERLPWEADPPITQRNQQIDQMIEQAHCRLLERATAGRLTWDGDQIVRRTPAPGVSRPVRRSTISKSLDKPLAGSTLK